MAVCGVAGSELHPQLQLLDLEIQPKRLQRWVGMGMPCPLSILLYKYVLCTLSCRPILDAHRPAFGIMRAMPGARASASSPVHCPHPLDVIVQVNCIHFVSLL
jgi:hypothetical protein